MAHLVSLSHMPSDLVVSAGSSKGASHLAAACRLASAIEASHWSPCCSFTVSSNSGRHASLSASFPPCLSLTLSR